MISFQDEVPLTSQTEVLSTHARAVAMLSLLKKRGLWGMMFTGSWAGKMGSSLGLVW